MEKQVSESHVGRVDGQVPTLQKLYLTPSTLDTAQTHTDANTLDAPTHLDTHRYTHIP